MLKTIFVFDIVCDGVFYSQQPTLKQFVQIIKAFTHVKIL